MVNEGQGHVQAQGQGRVRPFALALALALALPAIASQSAAQLPPSPLDPILGQVEENRTILRETLIGELTKEDVDVKLAMDFRTVDFDTLNVIFGGGRFEATARIGAHIDMRVLAASRVQQVIDESIPGVGNATSIAMSELQYIPADVFRSTLAGEALAAFQSEQEERLADFITETIPNVTVLAVSFQWTNTSPQDSYQRETNVPSGAPNSAADVNDPTFPPITLDAYVDIQYLERTNLLNILDQALEPKSEAEKRRKEEVADAAATYERSAFSLLGIRQVLDLQAFSGWNVIVSVTLPEGYTFEEASPDVVVARDLRGAEVMTLGKDADAPVLNPVALTLSNRFLVSTALLCAVLLVGAILRFPVLLATNYWRRKSR